MFRPRTLTVLLPVVVALAASACAGGASHEPRSKPRSRDTTFSARERADARVSGTQSASLPRGFDACLVAAGFASAPPGHGVAAQWAHPDGTVVAVSTDATQMATIAAQFSTADAPAEVLDGGVIIGGSAASATAARACVAGR